MLLLGLLCCSMPCSTNAGSSWLFCLQAALLTLIKNGTLWRCVPTARIIRWLISCYKPFDPTGQLHVVNERD